MPKLVPEVVVVHFNFPNLILRTEELAVESFGLVRCGGVLVLKYHGV